MVLISILSLQAGPCDDYERVGFDIESLEPACVSLEEAGLTRSHRSYQYSHMSFPAVRNTEFPHYEVCMAIGDRSPSVSPLKAERNCWF